MKRILQEIQNQAQRNFGAMQKGKLVINKAFNIFNLVFVMMKAKVYLHPQILKKYKSYLTFLKCVYG